MISSFSAFFAETKPDVKGVTLTYGKPASVTEISSWERVRCSYTKLQNNKTLLIVVSCFISMDQGVWSCKPAGKGEGRGVYFWKFGCVAYRSVAAPNG